MLEKVLLKMKVLLRDKSETVRSDAVEFLTKWNEMVGSKESGRRMSRATARTEIAAAAGGVEAAARDLYETYLGRKSEQVAEEPARVVRLREMVEAVKERSGQAWRLIGDYGFWFVTYNLAVEQVESSMEAMDNERVDFLGMFMMPGKSLQLKLQKNLRL